MISYFKCEHGRSQSDRWQGFEGHILQLIQQIADQMYSGYIGCRMIHFQSFIRKTKNNRENKEIEHLLFITK